MKNQEMYVLEYVNISLSKIFANLFFQNYFVK